MSLTNPNSYSKTHIAYLDALRGLAALTVVNEHFIIAYGLPCLQLECQNLLDYSPMHIWWDGMAAVSMFFVLSGLVLSVKYFRSGTDVHLKQVYLLGYTLQRICRIWLPYLVALALSACLYVLSVTRVELQTLLPADDWITQMWRGHPLTFKSMLREGFLLKPPGLLVLIPQAWTLAIELSLSLLLPLGLLLMHRGVVWLVFFGVFSVTFLGVSVFLLHFMAGLLLAKYHYAIGAYLQGAPWQRRFMLILGLLCYTAADTLYSILNNTGLWLSSGLGASMLLMYVLGSNRAQIILSWSILRYIGKVSFSLYLLHMAVLICLTPYVLQVLAHWTDQRLVLWLVAWLETTSFSLILSAFFYHWIEVPCMTLGRHLSHLRFDDLKL